MTSWGRQQESGRAGEQSQAGLSFPAGASPRASQERAPPPKTSSLYYRPPLEDGIVPFSPKVADASRPLASKVRMPPPPHRLVPSLPTEPACGHAHLR